MDRNFVEFRLAADDVRAIRFGVSPGHELAHAVRILQRPDDYPLQWGWLRAVRGRVPAESFALLATLIGTQGYFPDFFTAPPGFDLAPEDEAARLSRVPDGPMRVDLGKVIDRSGGERRAAVERMLDDLPGTRERIARAWSDVWDALVAPYWTQIDRMLRADIAVRTRRIATDGIGEAVGGLHRRITWRGDSVRVQLTRFGGRFDCRGSGIVLVPSVLGSIGPMVLTDPPAVPTLFYPAQGVLADWPRRTADAERALGDLIGAARASILSAAHQARTTSQVARDHGLAVSTASHHLAVLRDAGLVDSRRDGRAVRHVRTPLGEALLGGG